MKTIFLFAFVLFGIYSIHASCGLAGCPMSGMGTNKFLVTEVETRAVGFNLDGIHGDYLLTNFRLEYRGFQKLVVGGYLPFILLWPTNGTQKSGLGNAVIFGEGNILQRDRLTLAAGIQMELPTGNASDGLSGDHKELLGYLSAALIEKAWIPFVTVGFRHAFSHEETGGVDDVVLVNPHGHKEILYRVGTRIPFLSLKLTWETYLDGQSVLDEEEGGKNFVSAGFATNLTMVPRFIVRPMLELPILSNHRFEWTAGVKISTGF